MPNAISAYTASEAGSVKVKVARGMRPLRPNPSLKLTRYGTQRKPGPRPMGHHRAPGLRCAPPRAA